LSKTKLNYVPAIDSPWKPWLTSLSLCESLQARQAEVASYSSSSSTTKSRSSLSEALDIQVKLLQDEIFKIDRQEEEHRLRKELVLSHEQSLAEDGPGGVGSCRLHDGPSGEEEPEDSLAELEKCLNIVKEEEEADGLRRRREEEVGGVSFEEELGSLEGMDMTVENKIDLGKVAGSMNMFVMQSSSFLPTSTSMMSQV